MPTKKSADSGEIYQIKVTLLGTRPPIWRRLLVPDVTLEQLHYALQIAMGWGNCHLHEFSAGQRRIGPSGENSFMDLDADNDTEDESRVHLSAILARVGSKIRYTYDFGDTWEHDVVLEKRLPADPNAVYPACTGGKRAGPPEDCGGVPGFYDLLEALADPSHPDREEILESCGGDFDPNVFSIDAINRHFTPRIRRGKKAARS